MIVCLCNGVSDREILCAIDRGLDTIEKLTEDLNIANVCGSCQGEIDVMLKKFNKPKNAFLSFVQID